MGDWKKEAVERAVEDFRKIKETLSRLGVDFEKSFRARARELPSSISIGLLPTLTFCYSQAGKEWEKILTLIEKNTKEEVGTIGCAYGLYLYFVLKYLFDQEEAKSPLNCFLKIAQMRPANLALTKTKLLVYLLEIKKLAEAELGGS